jgi:hypothetical protein
MRRAKQKIARTEVVRVLVPAFLVSSAQQACRYATVDGTSLAAGYYLALWPKGGDGCSSYGPDVRYLGPFATQAEARLLQTSASALEIVEITPPAPIPAVQGAASGHPRVIPGKHPSIAQAKQLAGCEAMA